MTAIALWFNDELADNPSIWAAADSRVKGRSDSVLTDYCAKLFSLPVTCRHPDQAGWHSQVGYHQTFGFAFAGNTLLAQNSVIALVSLLTNLVSARPFIFAAEEVSQFVHFFLKRAYAEFVVGPETTIEAAMFGWCPQSRKQYIFRYHPVRVDGVYTLAHEIRTDLEFGSFVYLGDRKSLIEPRIEESFKKPNVHRMVASRAPRRVIEEAIADESLDTIGGDLQLGIADKYGFQPYALLRPRVHAKPEAYMSYLGHDLTEAPNVGQAWVGGLRGMC